MARYAKHAPMLIISLLASGLVTSDAAAQKSMKDKIRKQIEKQIWFETDIDRELTPGFLITVIDGKSSMVLPFGVREKGLEDTISISDVFELGSVTKVLTAALFAELDESDILPLETEFNALIPGKYRNPEMKGLTIAGLLAHQSGLPRDPTAESKLGNQLRHYADYTVEDLLDEYLSFNSPKRMIYSNVGYALLQLAVNDYEEMLRHYILHPHGMTSTGGSIAVTAPGYDVYNSMTSPVDFGPFLMSGGLRSTMQDLIRFTHYCLDEAPDSLWEIYGGGMNQDLNMALGWHCIDRKNGAVYVHTGRTLGHTSFIAIVPATGTAVIVLANSEKGTDDLGMEVLRIMNNNWHRKS